jgi:hypothetical protein
VNVVRLYPDMRMAGGDLAIPLRWFTIKSEAAYFRTNDPGTDDYVMYVVQFERQTGEWILVAGYAGEAVTEGRSSQSLTEGPASQAFDRGLTRTFLGRASYTIDVNRSLAFQGAVRQNGRGFWLQAEYSQAFGQHWRGTIRLNAIGGAQNDFLGQYRRNSSLDLLLRFSY